MSNKVKTIQSSMHGINSNKGYLFQNYFNPVGEPLLETIARKRKFSFQKLFYKFDKITFYKNQIRLIDNELNIVHEIIPIQNIKQVRLKYTFLISGQNKVSHRLDFIIEKKNGYGNEKNFCISEMLPPYRQLLKETGEAIKYIFLKNYNIPVKVNKPFFF